MGVGPREGKVIKCISFQLVLTTMFQGRSDSSYIL
jgi:hypothetical protein